MSAILAFLITLSELVIVIGSALLHSHNTLYTLLVYGSPYYLIMNLFNSESAFLDQNPIYMGLLVFHIIKYFIIFRAQMGDDYVALRRSAIVLEALNLALSSYYVNPLT